MIGQYISAAMTKAHYEVLPDGRSNYGEIPGFDGVHANAAALEECRNTLEEVLEEWLLLRISRGLSVPVVEGLDLSPLRRFSKGSCCSCVSPVSCPSP